MIEYSGFTISDGVATTESEDAYVLVRQDYSLKRFSFDNVRSISCVAQLKNRIVYHLGDAIIVSGRYEIGDRIVASSRSTEVDFILSEDNMYIGDSLDVLDLFKDRSGVLLSDFDSTMRTRRERIFYAISGEEIFVDGRFGKALYCDGNTVISINDDTEHLEIYDNSFSISLWVKKDEESSELSGTIISSKIIDGESAYFNIGTDENGNAEFSFGDTLISSQIKVTDNSWHNIVLSYDKTEETSYFYIDGLQVAFAQGIIPIQKKSNIFLSSTYDGTEYESFEFTIDQVRIFNRSIKDSEIAYIVDEKIDFIFIPEKIEDVVDSAAIVGIRFFTDSIERNTVLVGTFSQGELTTVSLKSDIQSEMLHDVLISGFNESGETIQSLTIENNSTYNPIDLVIKSKPVSMFDGDGTTSFGEFKVDVANEFGFAIPNIDVDGGDIVYKRSCDFSVVSNNIQDCNDVVITISFSYLFISYKNVFKVRFCSEKFVDNVSDVFGDGSDNIYVRFDNGYCDVSNRECLVNYGPGEIVNGEYILDGDSYLESTVKKYYECKSIVFDYEPDDTTESSSAGFGIESHSTDTLVYVSMSGSSLNKISTFVYKDGSYIKEYRTNEYKIPHAKYSIAIILADETVRIYINGLFLFMTDNIGTIDDFTVLFGRIENELHGRLSNIRMFSSTISPLDANKIRIRRNGVNLLSVDPTSKGDCVYRDCIDVCSSEFIFKNGDVSVGEYGGDKGYMLSNDSFISMHLLTANINNTAASVATVAFNMKILDKERYVSIVKMTDTLGNTVEISAGSGYIVVLKNSIEKSRIRKTITNDYGVFSVSFNSYSKEITMRYNGGNIISTNYNFKADILSIEFLKMEYSGLDEPVVFTSDILLFNSYEQGI